ncbi:MULTISPECIES: hypothetical protein [Klebsiella]|uniref:hypothetical protein n=1 Tax=Klebsiella TaxID=570 RepID=UPI0011AE877F|nr:hypothetical protein [Klebsiella michiganensis]
MPILKINALRNKKLPYYQNLWVSRVIADTKDRAITEKFGRVSARRLTSEVISLYKEKPVTAEVFERNA